MKQPKKRPASKPKPQPTAGHPWQTLSSRVTYKNAWMRVREDKVLRPDGTPGIYGVVDAKPGVIIIALDDAGSMHLIETYRYPLQSWRWELPMGGIDEGDEPLAAAQKELAEELGMTAEYWTHVGDFGPSYNGYLNDTQYVFVAEGLRPGETHRESGEAIRAAKTFSPGEVVVMIANNELIDGQTLAALMQYMIWQQKKLAGRAG